MACSSSFIKPYMNYMKQPAEKNAWSQVIHEKDKNISSYFSDLLLLTRWEKGVRTIC